jgi:hypothetical protein
MKKLTLYHYSDKDFKGNISSAFLGYNSFTDNSANLSNIKRSFFYLKAKEREYFFNGAKFLYTAEVSKDKLYNLDNDNLKLYELQSAHELIKRIKDKGFKGFYSNNGLGVVCLFKAVKIKNKIAL